MTRRTKSNSPPCGKSMCADFISPPGGDSSIEKPLSLGLHFVDFYSSEASFLVECVDFYSSGQLYI